MPRLSRGFFSAAGFTLASLVLYLRGIFLRESPDLLILSPLRTATILGLLFLLVIFLTGAILIWKRPELEPRFAQTIQPRLEQGWLSQTLLYGAGLILLACCIPVFNIIISNNERFSAIFARYDWLLFLLIALVILGIYLFIPKPRRRPWLIAIFVSFLFYGAGLIVQTMLLASVEAPYWITQGLVILNQLMMVTVIWTFNIWLVNKPRPEQKFWIIILIMVAGLFVIEWAMLPRKLSFIRSAQAFSTMIFIFGAPVLAGFLLYLWNFLVRLTEGKIHWVAKGLLLGVMLLLAYFYYQGASEHARTINISTTFSDQDDYINIIKTARELNFHYTGDQNRMPGYPFLQTLFYRSEMSDAELFEQGKRLNVILSLILLVFLFLIFLKYLSFYQASLLLLIVAFSLYIFKAPYIQAEISFYFLSFLCFVLMIQMLLKPTWPLAIAVGLVAGLGYLTKGTLLPGIALFTAIYVIKEGADWVKQTRSQGRSGNRLAAQNLASLALVLIVFSGVIYPYISQMKQRFGNYFYNVNTSIYIWYDEMEQAYLGEDKYHFAEGVPANLPADQIPSLRKYVREHTFQQAFERFKNGMLNELAVIGWQFSVTNFQLAYAWVFLLAILIDPKNWLRTIKKYPYIVAFAVLFFLGYFAAFAWYSPIASGRRFVYGLYIPYLFAIFAAINGLARQQMVSAPQGDARLSIARYFTTTNLIIFLYAEL